MTDDKLFNDQKSLFLKDSHFESNIAYTSGGSIYIVISENKNGTQQIQIEDINFVSSKANNGKKKKKKNLI